MTGWALATQTDGRQGSATINLHDHLLALTGTGALQIFVGGEASDMYEQTPPSTIEEQAHVAMQNQEKVLQSAGASFDHVFRSNWYVTDMRDWESI